MDHHDYCPQPILLKFGGKVGHEGRNNLLDFDAILNMWLGGVMDSTKCPSSSQNVILF